MGSREDICKILELEGFNPIAAGNGEMGVEKAKAELPDLILCDIKMPGMNGYDVLLELRKAPATKQIPIIFLTVCSEKANEVKGLELGAQDYIGKPFDKKDLLTRIRKHLKSE